MVYDEIVANFANLVYATYGNREMSVPKGADSVFPKLVEFF